MRFTHKKKSQIKDRREKKVGREIYLGIDKKEKCWKRGLE